MGRTDYQAKPPRRDDHANRTGCRRKPGWRDPAPPPKQSVRPSSDARMTRRRMYGPPRLCKGSFRVSGEVGAVACMYSACWWESLRESSLAPMEYARVGLFTPRRPLDGPCADSGFSTRRSDLFRHRSNESPQTAWWGDSPIVGSLFPEPSTPRPVSPLLDRRHGVRRCSVRRVAAPPRRFEPACWPRPPWRRSPPGAA